MSDISGQDTPMTRSYLHLHLGLDAKGAFSDNETLCWDDELVVVQNRIWRFDADFMGNEEFSWDFKRISWDINGTLMGC